MTNTQLNELLNSLSLEEKAGQLLQVAGGLYDDDALVTGAMDYFKITDDEKKFTGSILSVSGAEKLKKLQDKCMAEQPHHIPQVFMLDIINGYDTIYPVPIGQGASFNPALSEKLAEMAAKEGAAAGVHATFSPMCDLVRDARWGRCMESTGEDPYLNGLMGAAMVRGYQGDNVKASGRLASCIKHFAGYGGAEGGRDYDTVELSERTLRDDYLPAYKEAINAGAKLVMTSFNTLNRVPSTGNKWLLKKILRDEMNFEGMVISDYGAVKEMVNHGFAKDETQAGELALKAGVDMDMMSFCYIRGLKQLVSEGKVPEKMIDESVYRVLKLKNDLGLFENPYKDANEISEKALCLCKEHRALAMKAAAESFVLLKNEDNILPFNPENDQNIAFIGPFVDSKKVYGSWSFPKNENTMVTIREGIRKLNPQVTCSFNQGSQFFSSNMRFKNGEHLEYDVLKTRPMLEDALNAARKADTVVMCIGEYNQQTGEAASRTCIQVPDEQMKLLRKIHEVNENIITLVFTGRPLELEEISDLSKAVMVVWFPGTESGNAIANVLFGNMEPGGRIPMSFPYKATQLPCYYNRFHSGRPNDGTLNGSFIMGYIDQADRMLYPFGSGMSYTTFEYSPVTLSDSTSLTRDKSITASVTLKNTGLREGTETVQMYIQDLFGSVVRPRKQLKGIRKVSLCPGESTTVSFEITEEMFRFTNIDMKFISEAGECRVYIGHDSETMNCASFLLA